MNVKKSQRKRKNLKKKEIEYRKENYNKRMQETGKERNRK